MTHVFDRPHAELREIGRAMFCVRLFTILTAIPFCSQSEKGTLAKDGLGSQKIVCEQIQVCS